MKMTVKLGGFCACIFKRRIEKKPEPQPEPAPKKAPAKKAAPNKK